MAKIKLIAGLVIVATVLIVNFAGTVLAAPATDQPAAPSGTIENIRIKTSQANGTLVEASLLGQDNQSQIVNFNLAEAEALGLVSTANGESPLVNTAMLGQPAAVLIPEPGEKPLNPVGDLIAAFFDLDAAFVDDLHKDGAGYGTIAEACWLSNDLVGDASLCDEILAAKKSGDYSAITLPDGSTPSNWGQFKKAVSDNKGSKHNLGSIISGKAAPTATISPDPDQPSTPSENNGPGNNKKENGKEHGNNKDKKNDKGPKK